MGGELLVEEDQDGRLRGVLFIVKVEPHLPDAIIHREFVFLYSLE